ncbi:MAG TPA: DegT/DnrJ/EryC1/StrS family aminotransferase [Gemmatimonadales bacterium]|nr:DegT/DnrJ/EryC1/StrS family aminotransferase [Gemmatimonadales bacterium]
MMRRQLPVYSPVTFRGVVRAGTALLRGSEIDTLREELSRQYGAPRVELWGSGTQALQVAITVAHRRVGGAVALPGFQCYDLASAVVGADVRVALYDVNPGTLAPDLESLRRVLAAGARVVVVAPLFGIPVPWDLVAREVESAGGVAIEDAAQGHGASWKDRPLGSWGGLSVLSFGRGKGWCGGSGGALLARNGWEGEAIPAPRPADLMDEARVVIQLKAQLLLGRPSVYGLPASIPGLHLGETIYHPPRPPRGITKAAAAAIRAHRGPADREAEHRRELAATLGATLARRRNDRRVAMAPEGGTAGYLRLPLVTPLEVTPARQALGIVHSYPKTLAALPVVRERLASPVGPLPGAEELAARLVTIPTHSRLTDADRAGIAEAVLSSGRHS